MSIEPVRLNEAAKAGETKGRGFPAFWPLAPSRDALPASINKDERPAGRSDRFKMAALSQMVFSVEVQDPARNRVPGSTIEPTADLSDPTTREELSPVAIKSFQEIAGIWRLDDEKQRRLLGGISAETYQAWSSESPLLDQDTLTRISLLIGINRDLRGYFGLPWADRWVTSENRDPMFSGRPPVDYLIHEGIPGMVQVRRMLGSWRAGN